MVVGVKLPLLLVTLFNRVPSPTIHTHTQKKKKEKKKKASSRLSP